MPGGTRWKLSREELGLVQLGVVWIRAGDKRRLKALAAWRGVTLDALAREAVERLLLEEAQ